MDLTNIKPPEDFPTKTKPVQKPTITPQAAQDFRDPEVEEAKRLEEKRKNTLPREQYDLTDFGALQTDRGFLGDKDAAEEIHQKRVAAGEFEEEK